LRDVNDLPVLLVDVGGVLFRSAWEMLPAYERWSNLPPGSLRWRGRFDPDNDELWLDYLAGKTSEREYWKRFSDHCEAAGARRDHFTSIMAAIHQGGYADIIRPELRDLLAELTAADRPYGIFTNDLVHLFGRDWPRTFPEITNARWFIDADAAGALKPDAGAFTAALGIVGLAAEQIVFLDDDHLNVEAGIRCGMSAVLLDVVEPRSAVDHVRALVMR
jgi:putative hydrolase of the HAD superfamily